MIKTSNVCLLSLQIILVDHLFPPLACLTQGRILGGFGGPGPPGSLEGAKKEEKGKGKKREKKKKGKRKEGAKKEKIYDRKLSQ